MISRISTRRRSREAFTLMEVLLVLVILVILGSLAVGVFTGTQRQAYVKAAQVQVDTLSQGCVLYFSGIGSYPASLQDLRVQPANAANWAGPYTDRDVPNDPWGNPYEYDPTGPQHNGEKPDIWSYGPDLVSGTEDDIINQ